MSVLWREGSGSVAEVPEALGGESVAYTTLPKFLQILEEKGAVRHESEGRPTGTSSSSNRTRLHACLGRA